MNRNDMTALAGFALLAWHVASILADASRWKLNLDRFAAAPTLPNLIKLAVAEGVLIADLS